MINEKKLKKELQKRFDAFVRKCGMADDMKSDGYASCYDDVSDIIEQLAAQNDIKQLSHYIYSHLFKYRPLKGLLKSVRILSKNRTRPKQIVIRVSEEELAQIKEKVEQSGKSQQQYIIEALTQSNIVNLDGLKEIYPELKRQGNNLNQIAKKLNENGYVDYKQELPNTMKEVREVWQLLKQYLQKQA